MSNSHQPWEPDPAKLGKNWTAMFEPSGKTPQPAQPAPQPYDDAALPDPDTQDYKPWTLQRGQSRPTMMLEFRRFDAKAGFWTGWQTAYSQLIEVEYTGNRILSLDFATRQVVIEGIGLDELARHLQHGTVIAIQEYSAAKWPKYASGPCVSAIRKMLASDAYRQES